MNTSFGKIIVLAAVCGAGSAFAGGMAKDMKADPKAAEANRKLFHRIVEAINEHKTEIFDEVAAPTLVDHDLPPGTPAGAGGTKAKIGAFIAGFPDVKFVFENEIVESNQISGRGYLTGTHQGAFNGVPATGKTIKVAFQDNWRFENGKLVEYWGAPDVLGLLMQIGAIPAPKAEPKKDEKKTM